MMQCEARCIYKNLFPWLYLCCEEDGSTMDVTEHGNLTEMRNLSAYYTTEEIFPTEYYADNITNTTHTTAIAMTSVVTPMVSISVFLAIVALLPMLCKHVKDNKGRTSQPGSTVSVSINTGTCIFKPFLNYY